MDTMEGFTAPIYGSGAKDNPLQLTMPELRKLDKRQRLSPQVLMRMQHSQLPSAQLPNAVGRPLQECVEAWQLPLKEALERAGRMLADARICREMLVQQNVRLATDGVEREAELEQQLENEKAANEKLISVARDAYMKYRDGCAEVHGLRMRLAEMCERAAAAESWQRAAIGAVGRMASSPSGQTSMAGTVAAQDGDKQPPPQP